MVNLSQVKNFANLTSKYVKFAQKSSILQTKPIDFNSKYKNILDKYRDFIEPTYCGYTLNLKGVLISNLILSEFI